MRETYLVFVDHRFSRLAEQELASALPGCKLEPHRIRNNDKLNTVFFKVEAPTTDLPARIRESTSSFVDFVLPVDAVLDTKDTVDYLKIEDAASAVLAGNKRTSFKIEVKKAGLAADETAKSIEVRLGEELEERGYRADLKTPELMVYVILLGKSTIIGHVGAKTQKDRTLDAFRRANRQGGDRVNRAEFKIEEAIDFFGIDLGKHKMALDIGASPGGWTHYLSQHGIKVVAVDNALLNYEKVSKGKKVLVMADAADVPGIRKMLADNRLGGNVLVKGIGEDADFSDYDIIHIKANMERDKRIELLKRFGEFDILTIDTNTAPPESSAIANSLAGLLGPGAPLVMTIKLPTSAFSKHISSAETGLSKNYTSISLKKLPHNRRELTAYGICNAHRTQQLPESIRGV